jgi:hypothetical protein
VNEPNEASRLLPCNGSVERSAVDQLAISEWWGTSTRRCLVWCSSIAPCSLDRFEPERATHLGQSAPAPETEAASRFEFEDPSDLGVLLSAVAAVEERNPCALQIQLRAGTRRIRADDCAMGSDALMSLQPDLGQLTLSRVAIFEREQSASRDGRND